MFEKATKRFLRKKECEMINEKAEALERRKLELLESDAKYALEDDIELTEEQKAQVKEYWDKYSFIFGTPYTAAKTYTNRTGKFDPKYFPYGMRSGIIKKFVIDEKYRMAFQNKAYFSNIYRGLKQPETVCRKIEGIYFDKDYNKITSEEAVDLCVKALEHIEIVFKPSGLCGGKGVVFMAEGTREDIKRELDKIPKLMIVQEAIKQHPKMAELNPSTVNTVRMTTWCHNGEVTPLAALIKVGNAGVRVDNYKHGGVLLGLNMDGTALPWGLNVERQRVTSLPTGIDLTAGFEVPGFDSVLDLATRGHMSIPRIPFVSWDIAIDETGEAVMIEANFGGDLRMHQATTGPIFGDFTSEFMDSFLKIYYIEKANMDYNFNEFHDHIVITKYAGFSKNVNVPSKINGKPVTAIGKGAFANNSFVKSVALPKTVKHVKNNAFANCPSLESVTGGNKNLSKKNCCSCAEQ